MKRLRLSELGKHLSSRSRARQLREQVVAEIRGDESVTIVDLTGVLSISHSFADEFFAVLVAQNGAEWFKNSIRFDNALPGVRLAVLEAVAARIDGDQVELSGYELPSPPDTLEPSSCQS